MSLDFLTLLYYLDEESNLQITNFSKPDTQSTFIAYKSVCPKRIKNSIISTGVYPIDSIA